MKSLYTTVTNHAYFEALKEDAADGATEWTVNRRARPGDQVALYVCRPVSAIVATAEVSEAPRLIEDLNSPWRGQHMAEMHNLRLLVPVITRHELRQKFPGWLYWKQPRASVLVASDLAARLRELFVY